VSCDADVIVSAVLLSSSVIVTVYVGDLVIISVFCCHLWFRFELLVLKYKRFSFRDIKSARSHKCQNVLVLVMCVYNLVI